VRKIATSGNNKIQPLLSSQSQLSAYRNAVSQVNSIRTQAVNKTPYVLSKALMEIQINKIF
jgi:hypothetical protein